MDSLSRGRMCCSDWREPMVSDRISAADMVTLVQVSTEAQSTFAHLRSPTLSVAGVLSFRSGFGRLFSFLPFLSPTTVLLAR